MPEDKGSHVEWVAVFSSDKAYEVELSRIVLEEAGITAMILNKHDSSYLFGEIELFVNRPDAIRAKHILNKGESND